MRHAKSAQLETAPTKQGGESVYLFFELTIMNQSTNELVNQGSNEPFDRPGTPPQHD